MSITQRDIKTAFIENIDGVEQVLRPRNIRYMVVETGGGILGRLKTLGRKREADVYEFLLAASTNCKGGKSYYIDGVSKCGKKMHLEVTAKAIKTGTRVGEEGKISDVYKVCVEKALDADSRWGPFRRKKRIQEVTEEDMKALREFNYAPK